MKSFYSAPFLLTLVLMLPVALLTGCGDSNSESKTTTGTAATATDSPELTAVDFFKAVLVDNNLKKARSMSVPTLQRVLDGYASGKAVGRTLLNMSFDEVAITIEDTNKNVREFYTDKADVMLIFTGVKDGNKVVNMRMVKMVKERGKWLVSKIEDDPFARTGI